MLALSVAAAWFAWGQLSGELSYTRVGPRPSAGRKVFILLHGAGASGDDLEGLAKEPLRVLMSHGNSDPVVGFGEGLGNAQKLAADGVLAVAFSTSRSTSRR